MKKQWYVYIIKCSDNSLYTGITTNVERRLNEHNKGVGAKYTKNKGPVVLMAVFEASNRSEASKEEYRIKQLTRNEKLLLTNINKHNE